MGQRLYIAYKVLKYTAGDTATFGNPHQCHHIRGLLRYLHDAAVLVPSDNLSNVECAVSEGCRLLLSGHCSHIGHLLCQLGEVSGLGAVAHRVDQQHLVNGSGVAVEIDNNFTCHYCKLPSDSDKIFYLRSISGEFRWSFAHVYPAFSVRYSL